MFHRLIRGLSIVSMLFSILTLTSCGKKKADPTPKETPTQSATDRCSLIKASISDSGFSQKVSVTCDEQYAYLSADTYPDHEKMTGIKGTNEQVPVPAPGHKVQVNLSPTGTSGSLMNEGPLGVAVNGVPIYDYSSQSSNSTTYDPASDTVATGELDNCNGHAGRGDDYHYHASPKCMIAAMPNKGDAAIIGWAFDGYPIFGNNERDGTPIASGALDVCNGKSDSLYGYAYHTSDKPPYILQCLVGDFDKNLFPRVEPLSGKPPGEKPQGAVTGLVYKEESDGWRTMTYSNQGNNYYIKYKAASKSGCYTFVQKTFTSRNTETTAEYCRR